MATLSEVFLNIANAIRAKLGSSGKIKPTEMADKISEITSEQPQLYAPSIAWNESTKRLSISNSISNGAFTQYFKIYTDSTLLRTVVVGATSQDINIEFGECYVCANASLFKDSDKSNIVTRELTMPTPVIAFNSQDAEALEITNYSSFPSGTTFTLTRNGKDITEFTDNGINLSDFDWDPGTYSITIIASKTGYKSATSNALTYDIALPTPEISISKFGIITVKNYSAYSAYSDVAFDVNMLSYDEISYNTGFTSSTCDLNEYIETFVEDDTSVEFTVKVKVSAKDVTASDYCAGIYYNYYYFDVKVKGEFSISYVDEAPEIAMDPNDLATYYDDGGELYFTAINAGIGTITAGYGYLGEGQYERTEIYNIRIS